VIDKGVLTKIHDHHRKVSVFLSASIIWAVVLAAYIHAILFGLLVLNCLKIYHDRLLFKRALGLKGIFFTIYTFLLSCFMAAPVLFGFFLGKIAHSFGLNVLKKGPRGLFDPDNSGGFDIQGTVEELICRKKETC